MKKEKIKIEIDVKYGSKFQEDVINKELDLVLLALKIHFEKSNKQNKFNYKIDHGIL